MKPDKNLKAVDRRFFISRKNEHLEKIEESLSNESKSNRSCSDSSHTSISSKTSESESSCASIEMIVDKVAKDVNQNDMLSSDR